jgi:HD-GYP domain-containing protein (c-di-GMP phosphodiesterase class II)
LADASRNGLSQDGREVAWRSRPVLSGLLRTVILLVPIAAAFGSTWIVRAALPTPSTSFGWTLWWITLLGVALAVSMATERVVRRLLPLAMLLKLSMLFPDRAPSRFRVARHAGSVGHLRSELDASEATDERSDRAAKILGLVTALATHDRKTRGHAERVRVFTDLLSEQLKLPEEDRYRLRWAALLHDIGKLSVTPTTLNKPSKLDSGEWEEIRGHPDEGARLAGPLLEWLGPWGDAIPQHHERYDGEGYPNGLAAEGISEAARIVAVADSYDTMTSARTYQKPRSTAAARRELVACAGSQFDPVIVRAFLEISLSRLLWAVGPVSLLVHLPFLARLQSVGQASVTAAAQTAAAGALAGVTAVGLLGGPTANVAAASLRSHPRSPSPTSQAFASDPRGDGARGSSGSGGSGHAASASPHHSGSSEGSTDDAGTETGTATGSETGTGAETGTQPDTGSGSGSDTGTSSDTGGGVDPGTGSDTDPGGGTGSAGSFATAAAQLAALRDAIANSGIGGNRIQDLVQHLDDAVERLSQGKLGNACERLDRFIERVDDAANDQGHSGHGAPLDAATAADWIARAQEIGTTLAC